jgi:PAS domain S-box-containing protein
MKNNEQQPPRLEDRRVKTLDDTSEVLSNKAQVSNKEKPSISDGFYFLESMLNTMLNPILYKDRNGVYRGVNDIFSRQLIGLPEEEIVGYTLPEVCEKFFQRFPNRSIINGRHIKEICREWDLVDAELLKSGGRKIHEQEVVLVDGSKATFLVNRSTFNNYNGDIIGLVTVLQDITESKQSKKALEENEERYRIVTEQTGQLVYDNNIDNNRISWAGAVEEVFGYNIEEVKKFRLEDWIDHIHPEDRKYVLEIFMQARKTGGRSRVQYRLRKKDGTYIYVEDTGTYLQNEIGGAYRVLGVVEDITEQKLTHKQLEENEEKYRIITEQTGQLVYDYDFKSEKGNWGGAIEETTGYLPQEFQGISFEVWSEHIHPEDRERIIKQIMEIQKEGGKYRLDFRVFLIFSGYLKF